MRATIQHIRQRITEFEQQHDVPPFVTRINELVNQQAWKEAEQEEKRAIEKIAEMWEIVQAVTIHHSTYLSHFYNTHKCPFCDGAEDNRQPDFVKHEESCVVVKARKLVQEKISSE